MDQDHGASLNELDRDEWRDVARRLRPDWTEAQFDKAWAEFQRDKSLRRSN
jgi:hypothetical protein